MANPDRPMGFIPVSNGAVPTSEPLVHPYKATSTAGAFGRGDLVALDAGGTLIRAAAASTQIVGVFWGVRYTDATGRLKYSTYKPASQTNYDSSLVDCDVIDSPDQLFAVQSDGLPIDSGVAISETLRGNVANHLDTAPTQLGVGGHSNHTLDNSTLTTTGALTLRVRGLHKEVGMNFSTTETSSRYGWVVVQIAEHALRGVAAAGDQTTGI